MKQDKTLSVLIPVFNEKKTVEALISRVQRSAPPNLKLEIVVVDDGSYDGTREVLQSIKGIRLFFHETNKGKGAALKYAASQSTGDLILLQDADLEYDPQDYARLVQPLLAGKADLVMGTRFILQKRKFLTKDGNPFFSHYLGNVVITWLTNVLYNQCMTDYEACYKVFTRSLIDSIAVSANGFAFDNELICKSLRRGYRLAEVPIRYQPRLYREGKKITWRDGIKILWTIVLWRVRRF